LQYRYNFAMARILANLSIYLLSFITVTTAAVKTGYIPFEYKGSKYQTWYIAYTPPVRTLSSRPLIALHGGPGFSYNYMDAIQDVASTRTVVFYDQIGNGKSTRLDSKPDSFWSVDLFLSELKNVIAFFKYDTVDILGHSWGGMLGAEYAVLKPKGLNKLILSDSLAAMALWVQSERQLLSTFPQDVQDGVAVGFSDPARFRAASKIFYDSYGCTVRPWPASLNASFDALFADPTVAIKMYGSLLSLNCAPRGTDNGCYRFDRDPVLSNWTIIDRLKEIKVPTLVINGAHDIAQDFVIQPFLDNIPHVTHVKFEHSTHTPMWEERDLYMSVVTEFLA
jgi:proline-specific peptidase